MEYSTGSRAIKALIRINKDNIPDYAETVEIDSQPSWPGELNQPE